MSIRTLEANILAEAREFLNYRGLRQKDILAWNTSDIADVANPGEVKVRLKQIGISIIVASAHDKRKRP